MELGVFLDDDLFQETKRKQTLVTPKSYNAKICNPLIWYGKKYPEATKPWFEEEPCGKREDPMQISKHRADWAYRNKDYVNAMKNYHAVKELLPATNTAMLRDVLESIVRCHIHLSQHEQALAVTDDLVSMARSFDHSVVCLNLLASVYKELGRAKEELLTLQKSVWLHPTNCDLWCRMADLYMTLFKRTWNPIENTRSFDDERQNRPASHQKPPQLHESGVGKSDIKALMVCTGMEPHLVACTYILRARCLASSIRRHPDFVTSRYRNMCSDLDKQLEMLSLNDTVTRTCKKRVSGDLDKESTVKFSEADLVQQIQDEDFKNIFERHWFSWQDCKLE